MCVAGGRKGHDVQARVLEGELLRDLVKRSRQPDLTQRPRTKGLGASEQGGAHKDPHRGFWNHNPKAWRRR